VGGDAHLERMTRHEIFEQHLSAVFVSVGEETDGVLAESQVVTRASTTQMSMRFRQVQTLRTQNEVTGAWLINGDTCEFYRDQRYTSGALAFATRGECCSNLI